MFDEATKAWKLKLQITVADKTQSFQSEEEAETYGFDLAKRLINNLQAVGNILPG